MTTLVISPTYNECKNVQSLIELILGKHPEFHLLIVDDSSPDGTANKVKELQADYSNLHLEERPTKDGLGTAYILSLIHI